MRDERVSPRSSALQNEVGQGILIFNLQLPIFKTGKKLKTSLKHLREWQGEHTYLIVISSVARNLAKRLQ